MSAQINIRDFLHDILANKMRAKLSLQEFDSLLNMAHQIEKFSEKGLLIITLSEQLQKLSSQNYASIKKFMHQFMSVGVKQKPRKQREQGEERRRRRKRHPNQTTNGLRDLDQMVQQSMSNPSNLEGMRINQRASNRKSQDQKISEQNSKKSIDINKRDLQFAQQLNHITQQMDFGGQDINYQDEQNIEEYSRNSSSTSTSFGVVSNLSQKMDLLRNKQERRGGDGDKKTKVITRRPAVQATMTKKKLKTNIIDENLTLEKTRATLNESIHDESSINQENVIWIQNYRNQNQLFDETFEQYENILKQKPLSTLNNFTLSARKNTQRRQMFENIQNDMNNFDGGFGQSMHDFTTQPLQQNEYPESNQIPINQLSIFRYQQSNPTLEEISQRVQKPPAQILYELLDRMRKGELVITQENIEDFGQIRVELLSALQ